MPNNNISKLSTMIRSIQYFSKHYFDERQLLFQFKFSNNECTYNFT